VLEQGQGFADDVADGGSADIAEGVGEDIQGAQSSLVEKGEQDAVAVADLLVEDTAALGWSPTMRALLRLKRKSSPEADECRTGRAIFAEEGLAAMLSRLARSRTGFLSQTSIDGDVIEVAKAVAADLEAEVVPGWLWQAAIHQGFRAMYLLGENGGGYLVADLDGSELAFRKVLAS